MDWIDSLLLAGILLAAGAALGWIARDLCARPATDERLREWGILLKADIASVKSEVLRSNAEVQDAISRRCGQPVPGVLSVAKAPKRKARR